LRDKDIDKYGNITEVRVFYVAIRGEGAKRVAKKVNHLYNVK
jgi:hypothetical protein